MERYSKQILFSDIGMEGQNRLKNSKVIIIGCGALGTVISNNLARAGVGYIKIVDRDYIELSNLQRQLLFDEEDIEENLPKAIAAKRKLQRINSDIKIDTEVVDVNSRNIEKLCSDMDLILDATDNFSTRYLINDTAIKLNIPWIYGGVIGSMGMLTSIIPGATPCFRCFMPKPPASGSVDTCDTMGVLNGITSIVASYQSTEALKILTGNEKSLIEGLLYIDIWNSDFEYIKPSKKEDCRACGSEDFEFLERAEEDAISLCGKNSVQVNPFSSQISVESIINKLSSMDIEVKKNSFFLKFEIDDVIFTLFYDGRAILKGVTDLNKARTLYAKYIGY